MRWGWIAAAAFSAGCSVDLPVGGDEEIFCRTNDECPGELVCATRIQRCVEAKRLGEDGPLITPAPTITPLWGSDGQRFELTFAVSKALAEDPRVEMDAGPHVVLFTLDEALTDRAALRYGYIYVAARADTEGAKDVLVTVRDALGNVATASTELSLDFTAPELIAPLVTPSHARDQTSLALSFDLADASPIELTEAWLAAGAVQVPMQPGCAGAAPYTYCLTIAPVIDGTALPPGEHTLVVAATDAAGNAAELEAGQVVIDFSPPPLVEVSIAPDPVGPGQFLLVSYAVDEAFDIDAPPALALVRQGFAPLTFDAPSLTGNRYFFSRQVSPADHGGWEVVTSGVTDLAGNALPETLLGTVTIDTVAPGLLAFDQNKTQLLASDTLVVTITADEPLREPPTVMFRDYPMEPSPGSGAGPYVYSLAAPEALTGVWEIYVTLTDTVGNTSFLVPGTATLDTEAPALVNVQFSPAAAKLGTVIVLTLTASEDLGALLDPACLPGVPGCPALVWDNDPGFAFASRAGLNYSFQRVVDGDLDLASYTLQQVTLTDPAGNVSLVTAGALPATVTVDNQPPVLADVAATPKVSLQSGYDEIVLTFGCSEDLDSPPSSLAVLIEDLPFSDDCDPYDALSQSYTCRHTVTGADGVGFKSISVTAIDAAGNADFGGTSVEIDTDPPGLASTAASPSPVAAGATELQYFVTPDEPLGVVPLLTTGGAGALSFTPPTAAPYVFVRTLTGGEAEGTYTASLQLRDRAGNPATVAGVSFVLDPSIPAVTNVGTLDFSAQPSTHFSRQPSYDRITLVFDVTESLDEPGDELVVTLEDEPFDCGTWQGPVDSYTCTYDVTLADGEGQKLISIIATDAAGNSDGGAASVVIDVDPPGLASTAASPSPVKAGATQLEYFVTPDEPLRAVPGLTTGGAGSLSFNPPSGAPYVFTRSLTGAEVSGTYTTSLDLRDLAGNPATVPGASFVLDLSVPSITNAGTFRGIVGATTFSRVAAFNVITLVFDVPESLDEVGDTLSVTIDRPGQPSAPFSCGTWQGPVDSYTCTHTVAGADVEGPRLISITAADAGGNTDFEGVPVELDFSGPQVVAGTSTLTLTPGVGNPALDVTTVTTDTEVEVSFLLDEIPEGLPEVRTNPTPERVDFAVSGFATSWSATYALTSAAHAQGTYTVELKATDTVGNVTDFTPFGAMSFVVDTTAPSAPNLFTPGLVRYERVPWGRDPSGATTMLVTGGAGAVPASHWVMAYIGTEVASGLVTVITPIGFLARTQANPDGSFFLSLPAIDQPSVYLATADLAGNPSDAAGSIAFMQAAVIRDVRWVATLRDKQVGSDVPNPNQLLARRRFEDILWQKGTSEQGAVEALGVIGGAHATVTGAGSWRKHGSQDLIAIRNEHTAAFDTARGRVVSFGGEDNLFDTFAGWEWTGYDWREMEPDDPEGDGNPAPTKGAAGAYDAVSGRYILFGGGFAGVLSSETWAWDGRSWEDVTPAGASPLARDHHAMAYDARRGVVVLFGGAAASDCGGGNSLCGDTWEFDGTRWSQRQASASGPRQVKEAAMAYDEARGATIMFGGHTCPTTTLAWKGEGWTQVSASGPSGRKAAAMAYDTKRDVVVLFGGDDCVSGLTLGDTWEWNGTTWTQVCGAPTACTSGPSDRGGAVMVYDSARERIVLNGGYRDGDICDGNDDPDAAYDACDATWEWNGTVWQQRGPFDGELLSGDGSPTQRTSSAAAHDSSAKQTLLYGGEDEDAADCDGLGDQLCGRAWAWTGGSWRLAAEVAAEPGRRQLTAMAYDVASNRTVMSAGLSDAADCNGTGNARCRDIWHWLGSAWSEITPSVGSLVRRAGHTMAYDGVNNNRVFLFGGRSDLTCEGSATTYCRGLFMQSGPAGTSWISQSTTGPSARTQAVMVHDAANQRLVLFGGQDGTGNCNSSGSNYCGDTWGWNTNAPSAWTQLANSGPAARYGHGMIYDPDRKKTLLFGGYNDAATSPCVEDYCDDLWEFDGTTWRQAAATDVQGTAAPVARREHTFTYQSTWKTGLMFGGKSSAGVLGDTWEWDGAASQRPGQSFHAHLLETGAEALAPTGVGIIWHAGGTGYPSPACTASNGAELLLWDQGHWQAVTTNAAAAGAPAALSFSTDSPAQLRRLPFGDRWTLSAAVRPTAQNGCGADYGSVASDYIELTVDYLHDTRDTFYSAASATFVPMVDDFEGGALRGLVWSGTTGGTVDISSTAAYSGTSSLRMYGNLGTATTQAVDTTSCQAITWRYRGKRGPDQPEATDNLTLAYWNGTTWTTVDTWAGNSTVDPSFSLRQGTITNANALHTQFQMRFTNDGSAGVVDMFFIDDFRMLCANNF